MARPKKQPDPPAGSPLWMTTFSDMMTLLLCFFVLLYSMSSLDESKWRMIVQAFTGNIGIFDYMDSVIEGDYYDPMYPEGDVEEQEMESAGQWQVIGQQVQAEMAMLEEELGLSEIYVEVSASEIVIDIQGDMLFDSGRDALKQEAQQLILSVMDRAVMPFTESVKEIRIEGHTDRVPIGNAPFASNKHLSAARAIAAADFILNHYPDIPENMIGYIGYGESRPRVDDAANPNQPKNRRVAIVMIKDPKIEAKLQKEQKVPEPSPAS